MQSISSFYSITTYSFSALYTTIPHPKLKDRLRDQVFHEKEQPTQKQIPCVRQGHILFCKKKKNHYDSAKKFSENDIISMLVFLIDNILLMFGGRIFNRQYAYLRYKLCSSSRRLVLSFLWGKLHRRTSQEKRKEASPMLYFHIPLY